MLWVLMEILSHASAKKEDKIKIKLKKWISNTDETKTKSLKGVKFGTFMGHFQMTSWQWKGLNCDVPASKTRTEKTREGSDRPRLFNCWPVSDVSVWPWALLASLYPPRAPHPGWLTDPLQQLHAQHFWQRWLASFVIVTELEIAGAVIVWSR